MVIINICIKFGPIKEKKQQTLTLTALIVPFKIILGGGLIKLHEYVPCFEKTRNAKSQGPNLKTF